MTDGINFERDKPPYYLLIDRAINLNLVQGHAKRIEIKLMTKKFMGYGEDILLCSSQIQIKQFLTAPDEVEKKLKVRLNSNENVQIAAIQLHLKKLNFESSTDVTSLAGAAFPGVNIIAEISNEHMRQGWKK